MLKRILSSVVALAAACTPTPPAGETRAQEKPAEITAGVALAASAEASPSPEQQTAQAADAACASRPLPEYATKMIGADKASAANWPGFAAIAAIAPDGRESMFFCGGVLVDADTVITAAHCLNDARQSQDGKWWTAVRGADWQLGVLTNQDNISADGPDTRALVIGGATYRDGANRYDRRTVSNDIAYLKLSRPILDQPYARIAGALGANPALDHHLLWAAGFGQLSNTPKTTAVPTRSGGRAAAESDVLREAILPLVTPETCSKAYGGGIDDNRQICAGWARGQRDTCYGDSGGPLVAIDSKGCPFVVGVTSFGSNKGCAVEGTFGVYTRLSYYRNWIARNASGTQFVDSPPVAMGAEATSDLLRIMIDKFAANDQGVAIAMLDRETQRPFPDENGKAIVPAGRSVVYQVSSSGNTKGQLLLIDRKQGRTAANGQLSKEYVLMYPNRYVSDDVSMSVAPNAPATIGATNAFKLTAEVDDASATSQGGDVIALVLPPEIRLADLIAPPDRTKGFQLESTSDFPRAITQLEAANALFRAASGGQTSAGFGAAVLPYEIRRQ